MVVQVLKFNCGIFTASLNKLFKRQNVFQTVFSQQLLSAIIPRLWMAAQNSVRQTCSLQNMK